MKSGNTLTLMNEKIYGTLAKLKFSKHLKVSELTTDERMKELMREFAYSRNPVKTCISICRNGDITKNG